MVDRGDDRLNIRNARPEELAKVSAVIRDAYLQYESSIPAARWNEYLKNITDVRSRWGLADLIVAENGDKPVGTVTLYLDGSQEGWPTGWAGVRILAVHPAHRGMGTGRALMEECLRRSRGHGIRRVGLHTTQVMEVAKRMYERMGFERIQEFDFHPSPGVVVMAYCLEP